MWFRRLILTFYTLLFIAVGVASALFFWQTRQEYDRLRTIEAQTQQRLAEAEAKLAEQERVLARLRSDPEYVELVIRRRLGYAKPEEVVFRFED